MIFAKIFGHWSFRSDLRDLIIATFAFKGVVGEKQKKKYIENPEKIREAKLLQLIENSVSRIAKPFPDGTHFYLRTLMFAWMKNKSDKSDFLQWMNDHFGILLDALRGAEHRNDHRAIVAYRTILGLAKLYDGAYYYKQPAKYAEATEEARRYWEEAFRLGMEHGVLSDYLRYRIAVWLAAPLTTLLRIVLPPTLTPEMISQENFQCLR